MINVYTNHYNPHDPVQVEANALLDVIYKDAKYPYKRSNEDVLFSVVKDDVVISTVTISPYYDGTFPSHDKELKQVTALYNKVYLGGKFATKEGMSLTKKDFNLLQSVYVRYCKEHGIDYIISLVTERHARAWNKRLGWDILAPVKTLPEYGIEAVLIGLNIKDK